MGSPAPALVAMFVLLWGGCAGGQTGEITELSPCEEYLGDVAFDQEPSTSMSSPADQSASWPGSHVADISWESAAPSAVTIEVSADPGAMSELRGGPGCASFLVTPSSVVIRADDASWSAELTGDAILMADAEPVLRVSVPIREMDVPLPASLNSAGLGITDDELASANLLITLNLNSLGSHGLLFVKPASPELDEISLGSW